jgi:hypothetical protein
MCIYVSQNVDFRPERIPFMAFGKVIPTLQDSPSHTSETLKRNLRMQKCNLRLTKRSLQRFIRSLRTKNPTAGRGDSDTIKHIFSPIAHINAK